MKELLVSDGTHVLVDEEDYTWLSVKRWAAHGGGYAVRKEPKGDGKYRNVWMHREIIGAKPGEFVDHINHDKRDNRRSNLRIVTRSQNAVNTKPRVTNTSGFKGVSYRKDIGKWAAYIRKEDMRLHLGMFATKEEAALSYNEKAIELYGEYVTLNEVEEIG